MVKSRYTITAAVLIAAIMLSVLVLSIAPARARINNVASWKTVYQQETAEFNSDFLEDGGQNVLLGEWTAKSGAMSLVQAITFSSNKEISGTLSCISNSGYVTAQLSETEITAAREEKSVMLTLVQTADALMLDKVTEVTVRVRWIPDDTDALNSEWADFKVTLCPEGKEGTSSLKGIESNYLLSEGRTVVLGDWSANATNTHKTKAIVVESDGSRAVGTLSCNSDSRYIVPTIDNSSDPVEVTVDAGEKNIYNLRLHLSEDAANIASPETATVTVSWNGEEGTAYAEFKVKILPASVSGNVPENSVTGIDVAAWPSSFDWNDELVLPIDCPRGTDSVKVTFNGESFPEGIKYSTDGKNYILLGESMPVSVLTNGTNQINLYFDLSGAEPADKENIGDIVIGATAYKNGAAVAYGEKLTQPYYNTNMSLVGENAICESISFESVTMLELMPPKEAERIKLSFAGGVFPEGTRFSADNVKFTVLKCESEIVLDVAGGEKTTVFLDFSGADMSEASKNVKIDVRAYYKTTVVEKGTAQTVADREGFAVRYEPSDMIIMSNGEIEAEITGYYNDVCFEIEYLTEKDEAQVYEKSVDNFKINVGVDGEKLVISNENGEAKAGTYRLNVIRKHNGTEIEKIEIPFFINY